MNLVQPQLFIDSAKRVIEKELEEIRALATRIDQSFVEACALIIKCKGRVIVTGMGKSGHVGHKFAATLASTGTPAFFVHPGEASHGDLGMITRDDVVIAISNSGHSAEVVTLLPILKRLSIPMIAFTGNARSTLAESADVVLDISVTSEACPLDLAPTASTTVTMVLGDALAVALLEARGFTAEDFALSHPGGSLGKRLLLRVSDLMQKNGRVPKVNTECGLMDALTEMSRKGFGMTTVVDDKDKLVGVFTDGDLRRAIDKGLNVRELNIADVMSSSPQTIGEDLLAAEALAIMEQRKITALVVAKDGAVCGILHMHDLLRAGLA